MSWRRLLPAPWRAAAWTRLAPGHSPPPPAAASLESFAYEHEGRRHRLQVREHADGSGLVVVDARRLARLDAAGLRRLRSWLAGGARDAAAEEGALWGAPVLTGSGSPRAADAWDRGMSEGILPGVPLVATVEVPELPVDEAAARARALHALAIPHVIARPDGPGARGAVVAFVRAAEDLGLVAGVAGPAVVLDEPRWLHELAEVGLDHLALPVAGDAATHDGLLGRGEHARSVALARRASELEIPLTGEAPLVEGTALRFDVVLREAASLGLLGLTTWALVDPSGRPPALAPASLRPVAAAVERASEGSTLSVTWAAPALAADLPSALRRGPRTDGDLGVRVTADGRLLPPRGSAAAAGVLGRDSWSDVQGSAAWRAFLRQAARPTRCDECPGLATCEVDCPADPQGWA